MDFYSNKTEANFLTFDIFLFYKRTYPQNTFLSLVGYTGFTPLVVMICL